MKQIKNKRNAGFSLIELLIAMTVLLVLLGFISSLFARSMGMRARESRRTDALTSAQAALNVMSREIANSGFGIYVDSTTKRASNGIITADSSQNRLHFRSNVTNSDLSTNSPGEDITYFFDNDTASIVRYDPNDSQKTSVIVNRISAVQFKYFDYIGTNSTVTAEPGNDNPTTNTGRVRITVTVQLEAVQGQPDNQTVTFSSDVTLRNSNYMLNQY